MSYDKWTIKRLLEWTANYFKKKKIDAPRLTAELLLAHVLKKDRVYLYTHYEQPLTVVELVAFKTLLKRRLAHEPLAYILGEQGFYSLSFEVSSAVLIPRPETEKLVEVSLDIIKQKHLTSPYILDWGVGSGAVAISLAKEIPKAIVLGIDTSFSALQIAKNNIKRYQLDIALIAGSTMDVFKPNNFDIIVSNPPYIETAIIPTLSAEIKNYEPREALDGGEDGLKYIGYLLKNSATYLKPNGWLVMEIGYNQKSSIEKIISSLPFWQNILFFSDITGHDRVLAIKAGNG